MQFSSSFAAPLVINCSCSAKDVEDLLTEVEGMKLSEEKRDDKPKKDKKKVREQSRPIA